MVRRLGARGPGPGGAGAAGAPPLDNRALPPGRQAGVGLGRLPRTHLAGAASAPGPRLPDLVLRPPGRRRRRPHGSPAGVPPPRNLPQAHRQVLIQSVVRITCPKCHTSIPVPTRRRPMPCPHPLPRCLTTIPPKWCQQKRDVLGCLTDAATLAPLANAAWPSHHRCMRIDPSGSVESC